MILNIREVGWKPGAIYIGRNLSTPHNYGNPFTIGEDGDRDEVCDKHMLWLIGVDWDDLDLEATPWLIRQFNWTWQNMDRLRDKDLLCFCAPERCHGSNYTEILDGYDKEDLHEQIRLRSIRNQR